MRFALDSGKLLYALGVLFAAAALLYFVRDVVFDLSITVKAGLLVLAFGTFLVAGLALERETLDSVAFALAGVTYVVFVGYVVVRYDPGETGTFLLLALSAALFVGLGYLLRERQVTVSRRQAMTAVAALALVGTVLVGVDAVGGTVTYEFEHEASVTVAPVTTDDPTPYSATEQRVGTVTATNPSPFTRSLDLPSLSGCLVGVDDLPREDVWVSYDYDRYDSPNTIAGGTSREFSVRANVPVPANATAPRTYAIERGSDCGVERDSPTLVLTVGDSA